MRVRYNKVFGILLTTCGLFLFFSFFFLQNWTSLFTASIQLLMGILFLTRPYFILEQDGILLKALVGPLKKEIPLQPNSPLILKGSTFFVGQEGARRKLSLARWLASRADWERFIQEVERRGWLKREQPL